VIHPDSGKVMKRFPILNPGFPNDIAVTKEGKIFVSDSRSGAIYHLENDTFRIWHQSQDIAGANVLLAEDGNLWIGASGSGTMKSLNIKTQAWGTSIPIGKGAVLDGFAVIDDNQYLAGDNNGLLYMLYRSDVKKMILNTKTPQRNIADFVYIPEKHLLIIPTFTDNRVVGYRVDMK
jgi:streptogramin lyase